MRTKNPRGVSKKAVKQLNKARNKPVSKRFGKTVMKDDPNKPGRKVGYASLATTKLPTKGKIARPSTKAGRRSLKKVRGR